MIRLVVQKQGSNELQELDTFGNENINLTLQVDDIRDIESKNASYSKDFNLPATKNNNKFFEHYYNVDRYKNTTALYSGTPFDVYKNVKAFLYSEDVLILEGFLRLLNVADKNTEITYNVVLFNDVANIIETLADATIEDLDFNDINHSLTALNIIFSWNGLTQLSAGGTTDNVYYSLINDGQIYADDNNLYMPNYQSNYFLNIKLKYVIDKIFSYAGFSYSSQFFESDTFNDIFFDIGKNGGVSEFPNNTIIANTGSGTDSVGGENGTIISDDFFNPTAIDFVNESGDTDNAFNHNTSVFTAPYDCYVNIKYRVKAVNTELETSGTLFLQADIPFNYTQIGYFSIPPAEANGNVPIQMTHTFTETVFLTQGTTMTLNFYTSGGDVMIYNDNGYVPRVELELIDTSTNSLIKANRGDIKLADILKDVVTAFNLTLESKQNNLLLIDTYNSFFSNKVIDWTKKIDNAEFVVEPIEIPKRIEFLHAQEDDDYYHEQYKIAHNTIYGSQVLEFDVDSTDIKKIELKVFAAPFIKELEGTNINLQHIATENGDQFEFYKNKPRLIFKNSFGFDVDLVIQDDNGTPFGADYSHVNNGTQYEGSSDNEPPLPQVTSNGNSLLFGFTNPQYTPTLANIPFNTLFNKYWSDYIEEKFNVTDGLILKAEFRLKPTDIYNFRFGTKVKIQDQHYRVNKIEYNTDRNNLAKVELLRI